MNLLLFKDLPAWATAPDLGLHFAAGIGLGFLYFRLLWWNACLLASGGRMTTSLLLILGRFSALAIVLALASLEGALPLLALALGILVIRTAITRRMRNAAP